ncbi:hypothetical protein NDU88_007153 [Pleurodeles waltl]|uniref:Uncharacterized protein n=1 Tax=Pleurodeles waltl TaxID=8319 RepID=A0AAV7RNL3_PLEWA|nr:hypothetical protein NDU88_007153 [Pleurodeles waltl]
MGKADRKQSKLQFDLRKSTKSQGNGVEVAGGMQEPLGAGRDTELKQILVAMQHSLTKIDCKIDTLTYRIDRMPKRMDKHAERLDMVER